jgi:hypothetical protein
VDFFIMINQSGFAYSFQEATLQAGAVEDPKLFSGAVFPFCAGPNDQTKTVP